MLLILLTGLLAGVGHVLLGPDHLAALAPFSIEARRRAWSIGLRWGLGHSAGLALVAVAAYWLADALDLARLHQSGDYLVGLVLLAIGAWGFHHLRGEGRADSTPRAEPAHFHAGAALLVGGVHGIVGTGSLFGVVPMLGMHSWLEATSYLGGFVLGTIGAMVGFAALLGALTPEAGARTRRAYRTVFLLTAGAALLVGAAWIVLPLLGFELHAHGTM